jgi:transcriptional regulator with XRE-family HTH domain
MDEPQWPRLAKAVKERRLKLGLSTRTAAGAAGINRATWASTEEEERRLSQHLWSGVERALAWAPGSVETILGGGEPTLIQLERAAPASRLPAGFSLREEYERIGALTAIPWEAKFGLLGDVIDMYEREQAEQRAAREARSA